MRSARSGSKGYERRVVALRFDERHNKQCSRCDLRRSHLHRRKRIANYGYRDRARSSPTHTDKYCYGRFDLQIGPAASVL